MCCLQTLIPNMVIPLVIHNIVYDCINLFNHQAPCSINNNYIATGYNKQKVNVHTTGTTTVCQTSKQDMQILNHEQIEISSDKILRNHQKMCMEIPLLPGYAGIA